MASEAALLPLALDEAVRLGLRLEEDVLVLLPGGHSHLLELDERGELSLALRLGGGGVGSLVVGIRGGRLAGGGERTLEGGRGAAEAARGAEPEDWARGGGLLLLPSACAMTRKAMTGSVQRSELRRREAGALESARARARPRRGKSRHARFSLLYHRAGRPGTERRRRAGRGVWARTGVSAGAGSLMVEGVLFSRTLEACWEVTTAMAADLAT